MDTTLNRTSLELLTRPGPRLPGIESWLLNEVWTENAFASAGGAPKDYLLRGEHQVASRERVLSAAAESLASELVATPPPSRSVASFLESHPSAAVVIFDGCSLREIPRLKGLARAGGRDVVETACGRAAVPSETDCFVADRLGLGLPRLGPSQLTSRRELKELDIRFYYFQQVGQHHTIEKSHHKMLLWTRFPDQRYTDSTAIDENLFDALWDGLDIAWKRTVGALSPDKEVLVTSDHGYLFLGAGMGDPGLDGLDRPLDGKRFRIFEPGSALPESRPGLWVDPAGRLAILTGRTHNRPQAPSAAQSVYRHGGLSLMEMLTPWIVLSPAT